MRQVSRGQEGALCTHLALDKAGVCITKQAFLRVLGESSKGRNSSLACIYVVR